MEDKEKMQKAYLVVLICCTIFTTVLVGESLLLGWELSTALLLLVCDIFCWGIHITKKLPPNIGLYINVLLTMVTFFFYGSHETSIYDIAPVVIILMIMYSMIENKTILNLCMVTYYITMAYDFIFVIKDYSDFDSLQISRTLLHLGLVYMAWYVIKVQINSKSKERHITEEKIIRLEDSNKRAEDFLTNMSHELRTPINAVTGITNTMLRTEDNAAKRKDILSIQMAGQRLFNQIEDILDFTEIDTGRIRISEDSYAISSLINDIISGNRIAEHDKNVELIIDIDASMPAMLTGDGRKIKKIIKHLIDNGLKFTKVGGVYVKIFAMSKDYGVNLCIKVSDTGIGMSDEELTRIKEKYYQNNSGTDRKTGGLGLGLSIVYGMVSAMEGFIQVESELGRGTTVSISIPQKVADYSSHMTVRNKENLFIACFLEPEKYVVPEVRKYYNDMISGLVNGLDIELRRISSIDELKQLIAKYQVTHLFVGKEEYLKYTSYLGQIDKSTEIVVVSDDELKFPAVRQFKLIKKPIYCLPVVNILNASATDTDNSQSGYMSCPGVRVLVVDDEPMNLMVAGGIFKGYKMSVKTARSGMEAIDICDKESFDIIFLDHMMPEMDGIETIKRLRKLHLDDDKPMTIVAFTANAVSGAREMFLDEGFDEFISKPIEDCELQRVLKKLLPKSSIVYTHDIHTDDVQDDNSVITQYDASVSAEKSDMEKLGDIGIDTKSGLSYCGGDEQFYKELLIKYAKDAKAKHDEMEKSFEENDWKNYCIQVHALKSTSKMIGQDRLSEMARLAEDAAKNVDADYIKVHHNEIMNEYILLAGNILTILTSDADDDSPESSGDTASTDKPSITKEKFIEYLEQLKQCFATYEAQSADEIIDSLNRYQYNGVDVADLLKHIAGDIEDFEFDAADDKTDKLILEVKGGDMS